MSATGHVVHARRNGISPNRTLVRDVVNALLRTPRAVVFIVHDGHRLALRLAKPYAGIWRSVGPFEPYVPLETLAREIEFAAEACRADAEAVRQRMG